VLESKNVAHAAVTAIAGIAGFSITFAGESGHAGTVPLSGRRDAFLAAAAFALDLRGLALEVTDAVATIGDVRISGGARNVVPGLTTVSVDARAPTSGALQRLGEDVPRLADEAALRNGCSADVDLRWLTDPVPMSDQVRAAIHGAAVELEIPIIDLHSGAGHDAGIFAAQGVPTGMLFVRSLNGGASHRPDELSDPADIGTAISVLTETLVRLDRAGQGPESRVVSPSGSA
jgi:allantoate deiminase